MWCLNMQNIWFTIHGIYLQGPVAGEGLWVGRETCSVPSVVSRELTLKVWGGVGRERPQELGSVWAIVVVAALHSSSYPTPTNQLHRPQTILFKPTSSAHKLYRPDLNKSYSENLRIDIAVNSRDIPILLHCRNSTNMTTTHMPISISTTSAKLHTNTRRLYIIPPDLETKEWVPRLRFQFTHVSPPQHSYWNPNANVAPKCTPHIHLWIMQISNKCLILPYSGAMCATNRLNVNWTSGREIAKWGVVGHHGELSLAGPNALLEAILLGDGSEEGWAADGRRSCSHGCHPVSSCKIRRRRSRVDHNGLTRLGAEECEFLGEAQAISEAKSGDGAGLGNLVGQWLLTRACGQRADKASTRLLPRGRRIEKSVPPNQPRSLCYNLFNPWRTMQAPRAWYYFGRILFKISTPLHQMGFLECQIEHLRKIYTSLE